MQLALISKLKKPYSKYGGDYYYLIFKGVEDRKPYRLTLQPKFGNFKNWQEVLNSPPGTLVYNVQVLGKIVNGDSYPKIIKQEKVEALHESQVQD